LRTDTSATARVSRRVTFCSTFSTAGWIFIGAVSIVTPLELYEAISPISYRNVQFEYVPDMRPVERDTNQRTDYNASRLCGYAEWINCSDQGHGFSFFSNASGSYRQYEGDDPYMSSAITSNITEIFSSGSQGSRSNVAGAFDIEYRSYVVERDPTRNSTPRPEDGPSPNIDQGRKRTQGAFHMYESLILNDQIDLVKSLMIDTKVDGIGFRNHTVPSDPGQGSEWSEGLLWIQPDTACVSTNLSIDYTISEIPGSTETFLTDRGDFFALTEDYPYIDLNDSQNRPELYDRAYKGAVLNNFNLMRFFNTTRNESAMRKSYSLNKTIMKPNRLSIVKFSSMPKPVIPDVLLPIENLSIDSDIYFSVDKYHSVQQHYSLILDTQ
jgi:hypothetical protein